MAKFSKKGFYGFHLEETKFNIYLNSMNGWVDSAIFLNGSLERKFFKLTE